MIVVLEGADGCGKSTLGRFLQEEIPNSELVEFPNNDTVTGPFIRSYLRREWNTTPSDSFRDALAFQALQLANRYETFPLLHKQNQIYVRYWHSGWVYGQLDGLNPDWLYDLHAPMRQGVTHNILLKTSPETSMMRRAARDGVVPPERYEGRLGFTKRVVELYSSLWRQHPHPSWTVLNAELPLDDLKAALSAIVLGHTAKLSKVMKTIIEP